MICQFVLVFAVLVSSNIGFSCSAYVVSGPATAKRHRYLRHFPTSSFQGRVRSQSVELRLSDSAGEESSSQVPKLFHKLNSSTKWLVTLGNTIGVWSRPRSFQGPYIIAGAIASVYFTDVLKKLINQSRPDDSVLADPGMPSSHSLVSFFAAIGWIGAISASGLVGNAALFGKVGLIAAAATVAVLRVVCGYHTWAQIGVGAALGSAMGQLWVALGHELHLQNPSVLHIVSWGTYLAGSALFIKTNISKWHREHKHH
mmetsp:Transcript_18024/g.51608  ORF Transcript_18024/g.51608 Transcript_18024/m.51608 type:complete len:257 (+) Transcript_18024:94-864(+)|eukprot:CAMPEP_0181031294 /NCGR_PEP_ID=MMETSP1070-20121207/6158_1 /TAXON_ID=265543 /ORGANISM="Minutocellus polymorphus, Strain NH13" /LENGTH=256 /DNA_ID=CAMNT_0023108667 /DNA_START=29 /DNA_END=799 /DNA_ORIENTATION=-